MSNPTANFGWVMPTSTDLVTDLPADFAVFGQGVDTTMADLKGGTTGQILSKATNADMDFTWIANDQGDITGVTAGTGISGGGTSGTVTITNSMATAITTAGDLIKGTGSGTFDRLGIGSTGQILTVSGGAPVWASPAGGGKILQVVQGTTTTETTIGTTTMTDTTITANITPSATSSKVLIMISYSAGMYEAIGASFSVGGQILRGATVVYDRITGGVGYVDHTPSNPSYKIYGGVGFSGAMVYLDSPATTSATTYKLQSKIIGTTGSGRSVTYQGNNVVGSIILMEVGA